MRKYIKHRNYKEDDEIEIAVCRSDVSQWEANYPVEMLKEFSYLGYENWYGGSFDDIKETSFLDELISNYSNTMKTWVDSRKFSELICEDTNAQVFLVDKIHEGDFDILVLHYNGTPFSIISNHYIDELKKEITEKGINLTIKDYEYKHIGKIGVYDFSKVKDNGVQNFYHIEGVSSDSIDVIQNKADTTGVWFAIYHNSYGGDEVISIDNSKEINAIGGNIKTTMYSSKNPYNVKKFACEWYNNKQ